MYEQGSAALQRMVGVREPGLMDKQINNHQWKAKGMYSLSQEGKQSYKKGQLCAVDFRIMCQLKKF